MIRRLPLCFLILLGAASGATAQPLNNVVVFGENSVYLKQNATILNGEIVANTISPGPTLACSGREMCVGNGVTTPAGFGVYGDSIQIKKGSVVNGDAYYNDLTDNSTGEILGEQITPISLPIFSVLPAFQENDGPTEGLEDFDVPVGGLLTLDPGSYGLLKTRKNSVVTFTGGTYNFREIDGGQPTTFLFESASDIRVSEKFAVDQNSFVGPDVDGEGVPLVSPSDIVFYVAGVNGSSGNFGATPRAAKLGVGVDFHANIYVPNGTLWMRQNGNSVGAFFARDVIVGVGSTTDLDFGLHFNEAPPVNPLPVADPQTVFTDGANDLVITLTGSTPDETDLSFSIVSGPDPLKGSLGEIYPIVPNPVEGFDRDGNEIMIQPPIASAAVTYTPASGDNLPDSFSFQVENTVGTGVAVVDINPLDTSPPPPSLLAVEACPPELILVTDPEDPNFGDLVLGPPGCFFETPERTAVDITLSAGAPEGDTLAFEVLSLPLDGSLTDSLGVDIGTGLIASPELIYTPDTEFNGQDSFDFKATGTPSATSDTGTVFIDVLPLVELAEDRSFTTELNVPVLFTLAGNSGGSGTQQQKSLKALPDANIAGPVIDTDGDGFGNQAAIDQQFLGVDASTDSLFSIDRSSGTKTIIGRLDAAATGGPNDAPNRYATPVSMAVRPSDGTIFVRNNSELTAGGGANLLTNPDFNQAPAVGWTAVGTGTVSHDAAFGQPAAPSAFVENFGGQFLTLQQCVSITGGASIDFSARSFTDLSTGSSTNSVSVSFFSSGDCTTGFLSNVPSGPTTFPDWALRAASGVVSPTSANSARIELAADSVGASDTMDIHWDNVMLAVSGGGSSVSRNELVTVDPDTGAATSFGDNTAGNGALAVDPTDNQLYSVGGSIETIDIAGASVNITFVANTGVSCANADFDSSGNLYCITLGSPALYQINKSTGAATLIGALLDVTGAPIDRSDSIVFAPDGTLLGSGLNPGQVLFDIDPGTAVISNVRSMNGLAQGMGFRGDLGEVMNAELVAQLSETRSQIEFDIGLLQFDPEAGETARVQLTTRRIGDDTEDTQFYVGTGVQDGALSPSDFEAPAAVLNGVVMPIPPNSQAGDEGTFSFDVTGELKNAVDSSLGYFSVQGRVEGSDGIGLGVFTTASNNPPQLLIDVPVPQTFPQIKILTLPSAGIVKDLSGNAVMVGQTFAQPTDLVYSPPLNVSGTFSFTYQVAENNLVDVGLVEFTIGPDACGLVGRPPGCSPDDL